MFLLWDKTGIKEKEIPQDEDKENFMKRVMNHLYEMELPALITETYKEPDDSYEATVNIKLSYEKTYEDVISEKLAECDSSPETYESRATFDDVSYNYIKYYKDAGDGSRNATRIAVYRTHNGILEFTVTNTNVAEDDSYDEANFIDFMELVETLMD